jgi:TonB family protein
MRLKINSNGQLLSFWIVKSSGYKELDNGALASIAKAARFPPIPADVGRDSIEVNIPFDYTAN